MFYFSVKDQGKLSKLLRWAVSTAVQSKSEVINTEDSDYHLIAAAGKQPPAESLVSKLLRWLTASVILGKIYHKSSKLSNDSLLERPTLYTLQSWLRCSNEGFEEKAEYGCENVLAASIFYLIQLLDFSPRLFPSAVSALCLLLLPDSAG